MWVEDEEMEYLLEEKRLAYANLTATQELCSVQLLGLRRLRKRLEEIEEHVAEEEGTG